MEKGCIMDGVCYLASIAERASPVWIPRVNDDDIDCALPRKGHNSSLDMKEEWKRYEQVKKKLG